MYRTSFVVLITFLFAACGGKIQPAAPSAPAQTIFHLDSTALASGVFETEATALEVAVTNTTPEVFRDFGDISIEDGSGLTTYKVERGDSTVMHSMPPGKKQVTITAGGQSKFNDEIVGVFIRKITFNEPAVPIRSSNQRVVIYGDSIAAGGNLDTPSTEAWPVLLRKDYSVIVEAYGYRMLHDDAAAPARRSQFAANLLAGMPDSIWLAIGTNDYDFEPWSARDFGEAYAATLDAIHSSNPRVLLFAQSPIRRADESPNALGDSLDAYRQQIADACLTRLGWCIFVDGTGPAFPQLNELDKDGIHLTAKSSRKYAEAVQNSIGK